MERLAVSRTEATCPGASSRFLPQLLMYNMELSRNTNKARLRPASSIHAPSRNSSTPGTATKAVTPASKGGVPGHDDPHEGQDESKCPYNYAENRDHHPLPGTITNGSRISIRFSVAAQQQCQAESEQI